MLKNIEKKILNKIKEVSENMKLYDILYHSGELSEYIDISISEKKIISILIEKQISIKNYDKYITFLIGCYNISYVLSEKTMIKMFNMIKKIYDEKYNLKNNDKDLKTLEENINDILKNNLN